jgi:hypothetical protein
MNCTVSRVLKTVQRHFSSSSLPGPETYASAAPQPAGLLCNPDLDVPALTTSLLYEILAARCGIIYRPKDVPNLSNSFELPRPLSREIWSYRPIILNFLPTFATSRLEDLLAVKGGTMWV